MRASVICFRMLQLPSYKNLIVLWDYLSVFVFKKISKKVNIDIPKCELLLLVSCSESKLKRSNLSFCLVLFLVFVHDLMPKTSIFLEVFFFCFGLQRSADHTKSPVYSFHLCVHEEWSVQKEQSILERWRGTAKVGTFLWPWPEIRQQLKQYCDFHE